MTGFSDSDLEYRDRDKDRIGREIIVAQKEIEYEDGKNIISVIINAISVRINMPGAQSRP